MGYTENKPRKFVLKLDLHCKQCARDVKKVVLKIQWVDSVDIIDQEQGKVRISGNVDPQTVVEKLYKSMKKRAELLVEEVHIDRRKVSPQLPGNREKKKNPKMQIESQHKPVRNDKRNMAPQLPDNITKPIDKRMATKVRDCCPEDNHELELKCYNKPFKCDKCKEDGCFTSGYRCKRCVYDLHEECMNPKPEITHKFFQESIFKCQQKGGRICDACGMMICGYSYHCEALGLNLHPRCSKLPGKFRIGGTDFVLICKSLKHKCFRCNKRHTGLEVPGWYYVSEKNKFYCHVYCVSEIMHEAWRRGDLVHNNDGTCKALENVGLKVVAKTNGSGGNLLLKTATLFLKAIIGVLFGNPTDFIMSVVMALVQPSW